MKESLRRPQRGHREPSNSSAGFPTQRRKEKQKLGKNNKAGRHYRVSVYQKVSSISDVPKGHTQITSASTPCVPPHMHPSSRPSYW
jgi:hypothetical protein